MLLQLVFVLAVNRAAWKEHTQRKPLCRLDSGHESACGSVSSARVVLNYNIDSHHAARALAFASSNTTGSHPRMATLCLIKRVHSFTASSHLNGVQERVRAFSPFAPNLGLTWFAPASDVSLLVHSSLPQCTYYCECKTHSGSIVDWVLLQLNVRPFSRLGLMYCCWAAPRKAAPETLPTLALCKWCGLSPLAIIFKLDNLFSDKF